MRYTYMKCSTGVVQPEWLFWPSGKSGLPSMGFGVGSTPVMGTYFYFVLRLNISKNIMFLNVFRKFTAI